MAFRKKAAFVLKHKPDILIIPECEHPDKLKFPEGSIVPKDIYWHGINQHKGLGVFSFSDYRFKIADEHNHDFRTILPLIVTGGKIDFTLFAIWANHPPDKGFEYVGQIWKALHHYKHLLKNQKTILAGDFNSNTIWDKPRREGNHSDVVKLLSDKKIFSTYHKFHNKEQGKEKHNTLFLYRHKDKPYHLDYCFASEDFADKIVEVKIGTHAKWTSLSDHTPLMVKFDI